MDVKNEEEKNVDLIVCIGDEVVLNNGLIGIVEFIGIIASLNDENKLRYGIKIDLHSYSKYPMQLNKDRETKYGEYNHKSFIPKHVFYVDNNDGDKSILRYESVFVKLDEIKYIKNMFHLFRIGFNQRFQIPANLMQHTSHYGQLFGKLVYSGHFYTGKEIISINESQLEIPKIDCDQDLYTRFGSQYWIGIKLEDKVTYSNGQYGAYRYFPDDKFSTIFINLLHLIKYNSDKYDSKYNQFLTNEITINNHETVSDIKIGHGAYRNFIESVVRYWIVINDIKSSLNQSWTNDITSVVYMFYCEEYMNRCDQVRSLNFVGFAVKLGFDKVVILDNETYQELDYYDEKDVVIPWIDEGLIGYTVGRDRIGGLMDGKWWLKHKMHTIAPYNNILPFFGIKFTLTRSDESGKVKWRWGLAQMGKRVIIIYKTKRLTIIVSGITSSGGFGGMKLGSVLSAQKSALKKTSNSNNSGKRKIKKKAKKKHKSMDSSINTFANGGKAFDIVCSALIPNIEKNGW